VCSRSGVFGLVQVHTAHPAPATDEKVGQMVADETARASDENANRPGLLHVFCPRIRAAADLDEESAGRCG